MLAIDPQDLAVVLQGPVTQWTRTAVEAAAQHLPGAQIVLSTWRSEAATAFSSQMRGVVTVVLSDDPGGGPADLDASGAVRPPMNTQRMYVSSRAGLSAAERTYVLRTRSDAVLTSPVAMRWWSATAPSAGTLFRRRIVTCSVATRPGASNILFHLSDCFHLGLLEDVRDLWSASPAPWEDNVGFWSAMGRSAPWAWDARYANEQLLWIDFLRSRGVAVDYDFMGASPRPGQSAESDRSLAENFVVLEPWQLGVSLPKLEPVLAASALQGYLSFEDWLRLRRSLSEL